MRLSSAVRRLLPRLRSLPLDLLLLLTVPLFHLLRLLLVALFHLLLLPLVGLPLRSPLVLLVLFLLQFLVFLLLLLIHLFLLLLILLVGLRVSAALRRLRPIVLWHVAWMGIRGAIARVIVPRVRRAIGSRLRRASRLWPVCFGGRICPRVPAAIRRRIVIASAPRRFHSASAEAAGTRRRRNRRPAMVL